MVIGVYNILPCVWDIVCSCGRKTSIYQSAPHVEWASCMPGWIFRGIADGTTRDGKRIPLGWYCGREGHHQSLEINTAPESAFSFGQLTEGPLNREQT